MSVNPLLARLAAKSAALKVETPAPVATAVDPAPVVIPVNPNVDIIIPNPSAFMAKLAALGQGTPQVVGEAAKALVEDLPTGAGLAGSGALATTVVKTVDELAALVGVLPPDSAPREDVTSTEAAPEPPVVLTEPVDVVKRKPGRPSNKVLCPACNNQTSTSGDKTIRDHAGVDAHGNPDDMAPCVASGDTMEEAQAFQAKRVKTAEAPGATAVDPPLPTGQGQIKAKITASAPTPVPGFHLYLDTFPTRGPDQHQVVLFEVWIQPILAEAAEACNLPDYRLLDYKAAGVLAVTVRAYVQKHGLPPAMVVSSKCGPWTTARETLLPLATQITAPYLG